MALTQGPAASARALVGTNRYPIDEVDSAERQQLVGRCHADFEEDPAIVREPCLPAGTFMRFKGRRSVHRVSPVGKTSKPRRIVLYSYDEQPNMAFSEPSQKASVLSGFSPIFGCPNATRHRRTQRMARYQTHISGTPPEPLRLAIISRRF
jgi:hypothetical protein